MTSRFSELVEWVRDEGGDPWALHWDARHAAEAGEDVIVLSAGDPDLDTPPPIAATAIASIQAGDTHYTEGGGRPNLRAAIAHAHTQRTGHAVTAENALVVGGAQNGLFIASLCLAGPGDEVMAIDPMYTTYHPTIRASGARLVPVPAPADKGFHPDLIALEAAITPKTRALFMATPNNPTGVVLSQAEIDGIADIARRHRIWVVSDEVYAGLAEGGRVPSLARALPEQVLTIGSLSKTHAMTGWRSGWVVGPADFIRHAENLIQSMLYGLPGFIQEAAVTAIGMASECEASARTYCNGRRQILFDAFSGLAGVTPVWPDAGMFMLLDVRDSGLSAREFVAALYRQERISTLEGSVFGRETQGFVRICFAISEDRLREAAVRLRRFCLGLKK